MLSLGIFGSSGKMGQAIKMLAANMKEISSINSYDRAAEDISSFIEKSDFIVDFSSHEGTEFLLNSLIETTPKPLLIGTTALSENCKNTAYLLAKKVPIMIAPNVSIGANLQAELSKKIATILNKNYDINIIDIHHNSKKDAPSGTALMLAEEINKGLTSAGRTEHNIIVNRASNPIRAENEIEISSIRAGSVAGEHKVSFYGEYDSLTLTHKVEKRELLAISAIRAILWLKNQKPEQYTIKDMLGIRDLYE